ncbi:Ig-like domain repeat protein [Microbacterium sp. P07]|uniref:Ig-like domain repeat protein n=1 Tax=Microbacterium sp. P07 TaxID=3366952 RepID=UPI003746B8C6
MSLNIVKRAHPARGRRRLMGVALVSLIALGAGLLAAAPAHAETLIPENRAGGLVFDVDGSGRPVRITTESACPDVNPEAAGGYRAVVLLADGTQHTLRGEVRLDSYTYDKPVFVEPTPTRWAAPFAGLPAGAEAEVIIVCDDFYDENATKRPVGDDRYFSETIVLDIAGAGSGVIPNAWHVKDRTAPPTKESTTTTLAAAGTTANSTTLTATVAPAGVTGSVQFAQNGVNIQAPAPVTAAGTASISVSGLTAATAYSFTAQYSGDTTHQASASAAYAVTTLPAVTPVEMVTTEIGVNVPPVPSTQPTGLKIETKPVPKVTLANGSPRTEGQDWVATGSLEAVTVNDDRRTATTGWTLSGSASAFKAGTNEIGADKLSWAPAEVGTTHGDAGAPATNLSAAKELARGTAATGQSNVKTTVGAQLSLTVPSGAVAGDYTSTLTLTLI